MCVCDSIEYFGTPCTFQPCIILDIGLEAITETQDNNGLNKLAFIFLLYFYAYKNIGDPEKGITLKFIVWNDLYQHYSGAKKL